MYQITGWGSIFARSDSYVEAILMTHRLAKELQHRITLRVRCEGRNCFVLFRSCPN